MTDRLEDFHRRHRRLNRVIDGCRAASRQEEMKVLKRVRLRLNDRIAALQRRSSVTNMTLGAASRPAPHPSRTTWRRQMDFVTEGNIRRFTEMLSREVDPLRRATIKRLLKDEQRKGRHADSAQCSVPGDSVKSVPGRVQS